MKNNWAKHQSLNIFLTHEHRSADEIPFSPLTGVRRVTELGSSRLLTESLAPATGLPCNTVDQSRLDTIYTYPVRG